MYTPEPYSKYTRRQVPEVFTNLQSMLYRGPASIIGGVLAKSSAKSVTNTCATTTNVLYVQCILNVARV